MTWSSGQSHLTCLETETCVSETESKLDQLQSSEEPQTILALNPKCMTALDWIEAQSKDKIVGESLKCIKPKNCRMVRKLIAKK